MFRIGLECHARIASKTKLFSNAENFVFKEGFAANSCVSHFDLGFPGTFPILNEECVLKAIRAGLLLNCSIASRISFDRKHYLYKDIPSGYQITQKDNPIAFDGKFKSIGIRAIQLENDTAKMMHQVGENAFEMDFNRSGLGLLEIVTAPSFGKIKGVIAFVSELNNLLVLNDIIDDGIETGSFRVDANVNLRSTKTGKSLPIVEVKNVMGFSFLESALEYEINRQIELISANQEHKIQNETRMFCQKSKKTFPLREKTHYIYVPEHDLPSNLSTIQFEEQAKEENLFYSDSFREVPSTYRNYLLNSSLSRKIYLAYRGLYSEKASATNSCGKTSEKAIKFISNEFSRAKITNQIHKSCQLIRAFDEGIISAKAACFILAKMPQEDYSIEEFIEKYDLSLICEPEKIKKAVDEFKAQNAKGDFASFARETRGKYDLEEAKKYFFKCSSSSS